MTEELYSPIERILLDQTRRHYAYATEKLSKIEDAENRTLARDRSTMISALIDVAIEADVDPAVFDAMRNRRREIDNALSAYSAKIFAEARRPEVEAIDSVGHETARILRETYRIADAGYGNTGGGVMCIEVEIGRPRTVDDVLYVGTGSGEGWGYSIFGDDDDFGELTETLTPEPKKLARDIAIEVAKRRLESVRILGRLRSGEEIELCPLCSYELDDDHIFETVAAIPEEYGNETAVQLFEEWLSGKGYE